MVMPRMASEAYAEVGDLYPGYYEKRSRKSKSSTRHDPMIKSSAIAVTVVVMILLYLFQQSLIVSTGYRLIQAQNEFSVVRNENKALSVEVAKLKALDRIESVARNQLGMVTPGNVKVLSLSQSIVQEGQSGMVQSASLASATPAVVEVQGALMLKDTALRGALGILSHLVVNWFVETMAYATH